VNRLWVRLLAAFIVVALVAVGGVAVLVNWSTRSLFENYVHQAVRSRGEMLAPVLEDYYAAQGGWAGVETFLPEELSFQGRGGMGMGRGRGGTGLVEPDKPSALDGGLWMVANAEGLVVADSSGTALSTQLTRSQQQRAIELTVDSERVGWLVPHVAMSRGDASLEAEFLRSVNTASLWAGLGATAVALVLAIFLVRSITAPLRDLTRATQALAQGDLYHRVAIRGRDEIAELGRAFNAMAQALQEQIALRRHMVADIAHELRTPLSVLRGQLEAMLDGVFPISSENLVVAHAQTLHLNRLVEDLRLLALAEAGGLELQRVHLDLGDLLRETGQAFGPAAEEEGISLNGSARSFSTWYRTPWNTRREGGALPCGAGTVGRPPHQSLGLWPVTWPRGIGM